MSTKTGDMPRIGLEPTRCEAPDPKSGVSANFTTWAKDVFCGTILSVFIDILKAKFEKTL